MEEKPIEEMLSWFATSSTRTSYSCSLSSGMGSILLSVGNLSMTNGSTSSTISSSPPSLSCGTLYSTKSSKRMSCYQTPDISKLDSRVSDHHTSKLSSYRLELWKVQVLEMDPLRHLPDPDALDHRVPLSRGRSCDL